MRNRAFYMGGGTANPLCTRERRQGTVISLSPSGLPKKGGLRCKGGDSRG